jgi:hypothetical protein
MPSLALLPPDAKPRWYIKVWRSPSGKDKEVVTTPFRNSVAEKWWHNHAENNTSKVWVLPLEWSKLHRIRCWKETKTVRQDPRGIFAPQSATSRESRCAIGHKIIIIAFNSSSLCYCRILPQGRCQAIFFRRTVANLGFVTRCLLRARRGRAIGFFCWEGATLSQFIYICISTSWQTNFFVGGVALLRRRVDLYVVLLEFVNVLELVESRAVGGLCIVLHIKDVVIT